MKKIIEDSFKRCISKKLDAETTLPKIHITGNEFEMLRTRYKSAIYAFDKSCKDIVEKLNEEVFFILADPEGVLLTYGSKEEYRAHMNAVGMYEGISFSEESLGTNSISLSIETGESTYLMPKEHYCKAFHKWYCYCIPLKVNSNALCYLDISTIDIVMKDEIKIIGDLLAFKITTQLESEESLSNDSASKIESLTDRQRELVHMLLKGCSEKEIASKLFISTSTVKYHKSKIFEVFGVKNTAQLTKKYYGLI